MWTVLIPFFLAEGLYFSIRTHFFQVIQIKLWMKKTFWALFFDPEVRKRKEGASVSQFQSFCTVLAGCVGTGNLAGVATAITAGGPGAVFWMWVSAFLGMMLTYAENVLGIRYRFKDEGGKWRGGPMAYMDRGCKRHWMGVVFALLCVLVSFGMGNMTQINSVSYAMEDAFGVPLPVTGVVAIAIVGIILLGGVQRIIQVVERIVPVMSLVFIAGSMTAIAFHIDRLPAAFAQILGEAFSFRAGAAGALGYGIKTAMRMGIARGVFTNEAGLGSSVMVNAVSDVREPAVQGMWAIFAVFLDTLVMCSLTALTILTSGVYNGNVYKAALGTSAFSKLPDGAVLTSQAFAATFGKTGAFFVTICIILFAFATLLAWSYYGGIAAEYLLGKKSLRWYRLIFLICLYVGSVTQLTLIWEISDIWNAMMAIPNLAALAILSKEVIEETTQYVDESTKKAYNRY